MANEISKYFAGELTVKEKESLFYEISCNEELREEFIRYQQLIAHVDLLPREKDKGNACLNLFCFTHQ